MGRFLSLLNTPAQTKDEQTTATVATGNEVINPAPAPQPKADKKVNSREDRKLIEPKDAIEALQHILQFAKDKLITTTLTADGKSREFSDAEGKNELWRLRKCFRLLGGEHNGDKEHFKWTVPMLNIENPDKAVATKSEAQQKAEQRKEKSEQRKVQDGTTTGYTEAQVISLMKMANANLSDEACKALMKAIA